LCKGSLCAQVMKSWDWEGPDLGMRLDKWLGKNQLAGSCHLELSQLVSVQIRKPAFQCLVSHC
jgi:hypothetical protein